VAFRALYVDDEPDMLDVVKDLLERSGEILVDQALNAEEAEKLALRIGYDIIISDHQMGGGSGIDLLDRLRSKGCDVPFILFTGLERGRIDIDLLVSRGGLYLHKGGTFSSLFSSLDLCVREVLHRNHLKMGINENEGPGRRAMDGPYEGMAGTSSLSRRGENGLKNEGGFL
jgi:DNA-binding response OmpR family regulator